MFHSKAVPKRPGAPRPYKSNGIQWISGDNIPLNRVILENKHISMKLCEISGKSRIFIKKTESSVFLCDLPEIC